MAEVLAKYGTVTKLTTQRANFQQDDFISQSLVNHRQKLGAEDRRYRKESGQVYSLKFSEMTDEEKMLFDHGFSIADILYKREREIVENYKGSYIEEPVIIDEVEQDIYEAV